MTKHSCELMENELDAVSGGGGPFDLSANLVADQDKMGNFEIQGQSSEYQPPPSPRFSPHHPLLTRA